MNNLNTSGICEDSFAAIYVYFILAIVTFFFLLFLTSQASAETAWIKWERSTVVKAKGAPTDGKVQELETTDKWFRQEAFPSYETCMNAIHAETKGACERAENAHPGFYRSCSEGGTYIDRTYNDASINLQIQGIKFYCYPDTIDPRK